MFLSKIDIGKIKNPAELAALFSISEKQLKRFLISKDELIHRGVIFKRNGHIRKIVSIKDDSFKHFLQRLSIFINNQYSPFIPVSVHGFVKKRSIITNAQQHTQKNLVLNVDIKNFFGSITDQQIEDVFISFGFNKDMAHILAEIVCVDKVLATGFPTSPVLSNIVCIVMDRVFQKLSKKKDIAYTRYADDLTFSSDTALPSKKGIEATLAEFGFRVNPEKYRIYRRGGPQYVTGLTVVSDRPRISRRLKRSIRLELYYIKKHGFMDHFNRSLQRASKQHELPSKFTLTLFHGYGADGFVSFLHSIEPVLADKIRRVFSVKGEDYSISIN